MSGGIAAAQNEKHLYVEKMIGFFIFEKIVPYVSPQ